VYSCDAHISRAAIMSKEWLRAYITLEHIKELNIGLGQAPHECTPDTTLIKRDLGAAKDLPTPCVWYYSRVIGMFDLMSGVVQQQRWAELEMDAVVADHTA
jgi:hypothetical protein